MQKYRLKRKDRANRKQGLDGIDFVYNQKGYDYGLSSDDSTMTGIEHISVTLNSDGDYPGFTIPIEDLEPVKGGE